MSMGIDVDVAVVIHLGLSYGFLSYGQEIGRAGRSGSNGECILITSDSFLKSVKADPPTEAFIEEYIMNSANCRRLLLNQNTGFSIAERCRMDTANILCDVCDSRKKVPPTNATSLMAVTNESV
jgi:superfamily II DNA helicase RecQ